MLKTITMFKWDHDKFTKLIEDGVLPQPSMHFVTGPVHLGKEGEDEIINDVYFHTFEVDKDNEELMRFFESIANYINTKIIIPSSKSKRMEVVFDRACCSFMVVYKTAKGTITDQHTMGYSTAINNWLMAKKIM